LGTHSTYLVAQFPTFHSLFWACSETSFNDAGLKNNSIMMQESLFTAVLAIGRYEILESS
jgi:hypothetical protein